MDEKSKPLLSDESSGYVTKKKKVSGKWIVRVVMWVIFISWSAFIFVFPTNFVSELYRKWLIASEGTMFGRTGLTFLIFSGPILAIVFVATAYMAVFGNDDDCVMEKKRFGGFRLWTFPVVVDGPFGVVSAAEMIGIVVLSVYVVWAFALWTLRNTQIIQLFNLPSPNYTYSVVMLELTGLRLGSIGQFCLALLFLPVTRGSILLRVIDIPFEHATRYHVWLGHLTMLLFTLHGLLFVIGWAIQGRLLHELLEWKSVGIANLPGVISLVAGLLMWVTSLPGVRRINFELFFYTHQLYVVFVIGLVLHVGDFIFCYAAGGIFLFMMDRFLRFCQSRRTVDIVSARTFPCGTLELIISKPAKLHYNALGWVFLQVRELSWLQWHPFSVSSSPLDGKNHVAILIKVLGDWTERLEKLISNKGNGKLRASVEGPYGHGSPYHLTYENLILVAGGIGISPFLAILSDILHRVNDGKPCLPKNILVVWAVKTSDEIPLLQTLGVEFSDKINLEIQIYVTRQSEPPSLEEGKTLVEGVDGGMFPVPRGTGMSVLVGTGNIIWSGLYVLVSTLGFICTQALLNAWYIKPYNVEAWWYKGLVLMGCMVVGVVVFGGVVICMWHLWEAKTSSAEEETVETRTKSKNVVDTKYASSTIYGQRPEFGRIFESMAEKLGMVDIGVIVCGPPALQTSVAKECRTQNLKKRSNLAVFHFNSHSFDL